MTVRSLQRMIHVGCRDLGLDQDTRRDLQLAVTGKASMSDMDEPDLERMIDALKKRGFKPFGTKSGRRGRPLAPRGDLRFVHVLWKLLGDAGALKRPGRDGLNAFIRSRFENAWDSVPIDVDALSDPAQINAVIRALKDMCRRSGVTFE
ncbi:regulatory protein GemA [Ponticoccus gilvus]|nr:regulatory protein GemA [Enemella evansiae]